LTTFQFNTKVPGAARATSQPNATFDAAIFSPSLSDEVLRFLCHPSRDGGTSVDPHASSAEPLLPIKRRGADWPPSRFSFLPSQAAFQQPTHNRGESTVALRS